MAEPALTGEIPTVTHIAGIVVTINGRFLRQRCAWCEYVLLDYDLTHTAVRVGEDPTPATWPQAVLVRVDGDETSGRAAWELAYGENDPLPEDSCTNQAKPGASATGVGA